MRNDSESDIAGSALDVEQQRTLQLKHPSICKPSVMYAWRMLRPELQHVVNDK
jgi:hypothetical protein